MADAHSTESWRPVDGWPQYEVSDFGNIRHIRTRKPVGQWLNDQGYAIARFSQPRKMVRVHRLVAAAFVPNPEGRPEVNHLDGQKANNVAHNLEWVTSRGNREHAWAIGLRDRSDLPIKRGESNPQAKLTVVLVDQARKRHAAGETIKGLAREYGVHSKTMRSAIRGETWLPAPPDTEGA